MAEGNNSGYMPVRPGQVRPKVEPTKQEEQKQAKKEPDPPKTWWDTAKAGFVVSIVLMFFYFALPFLGPVGIIAAVAATAYGAYKVAQNIPADQRHKIGESMQKTPGLGWIGKKLIKTAEDELGVEHFLTKDQKTPAIPPPAITPPAIPPPAITQDERDAPVQTNDKPTIEPKDNGNTKAENKDVVTGFTFGEKFPLDPNAPQVVEKKIIKETNNNLSYSAGLDEKFSNMLDLSSNRPERLDIVSKKLQSPLIDREIREKLKNTNLVEGFKTLTIEQKTNVIDRLNEMDISKVKQSVQMKSVVGRDINVPDNKLEGKSQNRTK